MGKGQTTYPLTDEQKLTLGKQNMRAACPGQAGIQFLPALWLLGKFPPSKLTTGSFFLTPFLCKQVLVAEMNTFENFENYSFSSFPFSFSISPSCWAFTWWTLQSRFILISFCVLLFFSHIFVESKWRLYSKQNSLNRKIAKTSWLHFQTCTLRRWRSQPRITTRRHDARRHRDLILLFPGILTLWPLNDCLC